MNCKPRCKVSILILTHNRPELFNRCIHSVLEDKPDWAEVIVNNDGCPIHSFVGVDYYNEVNEDLSLTYKFLFDKAQGEYIYYLEDDDFVTEQFWQIVEEDIKINKNILYRYLPENDIKKYIEYFVKEPNLKEHFQIGQMLFKKADLKEFPKGNCLDNDWKMYTQMKFINSSVCIFTQTTDGKDNISFPQHNKDERFI